MKYFSYHWYFNIRSGKRYICSVVPPTKTAQIISSIFSPKVQLWPNWQQSITKMAVARLRYDADSLGSISYNLYYHIRSGKILLWSVPSWLAVQQSKYVFFLILYDSINDMKHLRTICITPHPCNSHFCCLWLPIRPNLDVETINDMKHFPNFLHHTSAVPQPFLLLFAANLALTGFLGWKWSLWSVPTWLEVQRSKAVFILTLYDSISYMKYFRNCLH